MNYLQVRQRALDLLNRTDGSDTLMQTFVQMGLQRIQRELRLPHMERVLTLDTSAGPLSQFPVPADWIETIAFFSDNANGVSDEVKWINIGSFQRKKNYKYGHPVYYSRLFSNFLVADVIPQGANASLYYYGEEGALVNDTDETTLSVIAPDLIVYAALTYAADEYIDDRGQTWEQKFQFLREQLQSQASEGEDETGDGAIEPAYQFEDSVW